MTLEQLVRIVAEAVEKAVALSRLRVAAYAFDPANGKAVREAAETLNGNCLSADFEAAEQLWDVLFVDQIPVSYLAKLALGIGDDGPTRRLAETVLNGRTIFVLKGVPDPENAPRACRALLSAYRKMLRSYGYVFLGADRGEKKGYSSPVEENEGIYEKNVLSRRDLLEWAQGGTAVTVGGHVRVTDLASDTARAMNIEIRRIEGVGSKCG